MSELRFTLLGRFHASDGNAAVQGLEARKVQELLAYLLVHGLRTHTREMLTEMLWANQPPAQSKKYLRQALWQIQSAFDSHLTAGDPPVLLADAEWVRANPEAHCWVDVSAFEEAYACARGIAGRDLANAPAEALAAAVELYGGNLLEGCYEDWCLFERERLQTMLIAMLGKLIDCCEAHGQYEAGLAYGDRILSYDYAHERTHRRLMRLYYLAGDRTAALRQYQRCLDVLAQELGVKPARSTAELYERIRADLPVDDLSSGLREQGLGAGRDAVTDLLASLRSLNASLAALQGRIGAVEDTLSGE